MPTPQNDHRPIGMRKSRSTRYYWGHFDTYRPTPSQRCKKLGAKRPTRCIETITNGKLIIVRFQRVVDGHQRLRTHPMGAETRKRSKHLRPAQNRQFRPTRVAVCGSRECSRPSRYVNLYISEKLTFFSSLWCWCHYLRMITDRRQCERVVLLDTFGVTLTHSFQLQVKDVKS